MNQANLNPSYIGPRPDVVSLIPLNARKVLDVGCSVGALGEAVKERSGATVIGIELDSEMADIARGRLDGVLLGDVETLFSDPAFPGAPYDCIIFADLLEHLRDPWTVLRTAHSLLDQRGVVVASLPNIRHYTTILNLMRGHWPYRDRGIHDRTHLRFFTLAGIRELFSDAGFRIAILRRKYRLIERPHAINVVARFFGLWPFRDFLTFQYLLVATKEPAVRV